MDVPFLDEGKKGAVPFVFLHAFPYHSGMWDAERNLVRERARFVAIDARGLGARGMNAGAYMLENMVDDLLAVLDHLSLQRCVLVGLSMGGYVALRAAQRAPERLSGLVLANTQAASDADAGKLARADGLRALWSKGRDAFGEAQINRQLSPHTLRTKPEVVSRLRALIQESSSEGIAAALVAIATRTDTTSTLKELRVPTHVIVGEHDVITPPTAARSMAEQIPGAKLHVLSNAGHISNLEAPEDFQHVLGEMMEQVR